MFSFIDSVWKTVQATGADIADRLQRALEEERILAEVTALTEESLLAEVATLTTEINQRIPLNALDYPLAVFAQTTNREDLFLEERNPQGKITALIFTLREHPEADGIQHTVSSIEELYRSLTIPTERIGGTLRNPLAEKITSLNNTIAMTNETHKLISLFIEMLGISDSICVMNTRITTSAAEMKTPLEEIKVNQLEALKKLVVKIKTTLIDFKLKPIITVPDREASPDGAAAETAIASSPDRVSELPTSPSPLSFLSAEGPRTTGLITPKAVTCFPE